MTKHVVENSMVAHLWAHQSQESARSRNGNFWFEGRTIYSYRTPVANIVDGAAGPIALVSKTNYSQTTEQHIGDILSALGYGDGTVLPYFTVPYIGATGGQSPDYATRDYSRSYSKMEICHPANIDWLIGRFRDLLAKALRARPDNAGWCFRDAEGMAARATRYRELFGLSVELPDFAAEVKAAEDKRAVKDAKYNTPEAIAHREKEAAARIERSRRDYREVRGIYGEKWREPFRYRDNSIFTPEDQAARAERLTAINADRVAAWREGGNVSLPYGVATMLRVRGNEIQTSLGATFPVEHGRKAFPLIARVRMSGKGWQRNGHSIHLGHFQIDRISETGNVVAGCHRVEWAEIERCARELGIIGLEPTAENPLGLFRPEDHVSAGCTE